MTNLIEVNGAVLRYDLSGSGEDVLVLIHEMGGAIESWDEVTPALSDRFRVLRYDQRGFGLSEKTRSLTMEGIVGDLIALLDVLELSAPVHVAGTAIGGAICLAMAAWYPRRVKRMLVASPAPGGVEAAARPLLEARMAVVARDGVRAVVDASMDRIYPPEHRQHRQRFENLRMRWMTLDRDSFIALNRVLVTIDLAPEFHKIVCPTRVIGCSHDVIRPALMSRKIAEEIPGASYVEVDSGHFLAIESPALFIEQALAFFPRR